MANPVFAQTIAQPTATFPTDAGDKPIVNDDELLHRYPGTLGGKTGFTDAAKKTFVAAADRGGRRLVIAMMYGLIKEGGPTYWDQADGLFDWGFAQDRQVSVGVALDRASSKVVDPQRIRDLRAAKYQSLAQDTLSAPCERCWLR